MKKPAWIGMTALAAALLLGSAPLSAGAADADRIWESSVTDSGEMKTFSTVDVSKVKNREILVKTADIRKVTAAFGVKETAAPANLKENGISIVSVPASKNYQSVLAELQSSKDVEIAEPNQLVEKSGFGVQLPADQQVYAKQWHLQKVNVPAVWEKVTPKKTGIKVAVIDTGVDPSHPDLAGRILKGYNVMDKSTNSMDVVGHGTAIAGIIAATGAQFGLGMNPTAQILPIKAGGSLGIYESDSINAIYYAIKQKANVLNLSYGATQSSKLHFDALYKAYSKGIVIVAATGNESASKVSYPANYPFVFSVGSTDRTDRRSKFSSYGASIDMAAPGEDIVTTGFYRNYVVGTGTSFSAPMVAGAASLLLSKTPTLKPAQVEYLLEKGSKKIGSYRWNSKAGYGRLDAANSFKIKLPSLKLDTGNFRTKAKKLYAGKKYTDKYHIPGDSDWYKMTVKKTTKYRLTAGAVTGMDPVIWMDHYNKNGRRVLEKQFNKAGLGKKETFTYTFKPGTYYFELYDKYWHWSDTSYSLRLDKVK